jgi:hypothetical protein
MRETYGLGWIGFKFSPPPPTVRTRRPRCSSLRYGIEHRDFANSRYPKTDPGHPCAARCDRQRMRQRLGPLHHNEHTMDCVTGKSPALSASARCSHARARCRAWHRTVAAMPSHALGNGPMPRPACRSLDAGTLTSGAWPWRSSRTNKKAAAAMGWCGEALLLPSNEGDSELTGYAIR